MGQKVHPIGFRLGINRNWNSRWFAKKGYSSLVLEDYHLRKFLKQRLSQAGVSRVEVERASNKVRIKIHTARPGLVIGKKGVEKVLELKLNSDEKKQFNNSVKAVKNLTALAKKLTSK